MTERRRILLVIDWFIPGFRAGGPIRSCYNLITRLQPYFEFDIFTSDRDMGDDKPYENVKFDAWNEHPDGFRIYYARAGKTMSTFLRVARQHRYDVIYLNSVFSFWFSILPLLLLKVYSLTDKVVLAPRGMLGKGALELKSFKKSLFIRCSKWIGLHKNVTWHATSVFEAQEIKDAMGHHVKVQIALDTGTVQTVPYHAKHKEANQLEIIFISRLSKKKNLDYALRALAPVQSTYRINFHIYGPVEEPDYWQTCLDLIAKLPPHIKVHYHGEVDPDQVIALFQQAHLFFFPTLHENFGHVIHESLLGSCPVLLSDQTPWQTLDITLAGVALPLSDMEAFTLQVERFAAFNQQEYDEWSMGASQTAHTFGLNEGLIQQCINLFT